MNPKGQIRLEPGDQGPDVADVQRRLEAVGFSSGIDPGGSYQAGTRAAVEAFQYRRGLRVDVVCGRQTWSALVEAGRQLGDRFLYRRTPMLRGDDVAELQQRLSALGFDTGRVDGIFGDTTSVALGDFQRNVGLPVDGIAGASTVSELLRFGTRHDDTELVTSVRDRELLRQSPRTLAGRRVAIGEEGGLDAAVAGLRRLLVSEGAVVSTHHHPDGSIQASEANAGGAEVYIGLRLDAGGRHCSTAYYAVERYSSPGGRRLAELLQGSLPASLDLPDGGSRGMSVPVLRETRMPAVICEISPATVVVERAATLARATVDALGQWVNTPWD
ncbi:MAG: peptidoglycan-binding protein [Acidimicrobiales bacterium]